VLTSTSGLGNYLSVVTDPCIRLHSVFNKILPPAPWDTTRRPISGVTCGVWTQPTEEVWTQHILRLEIHSSSAQLEVA